MSSSTLFDVSVADWQRDGEVLSHIRFTVFVREQGVPLEMERDELDADTKRCVHVLARDAAGGPGGTGRLILDAPVPRIGRMAVLKAYRGTGMGGSILERLCEEAKHRGFREVLLHSQTHAAPFYYKHGFVSHGAEFFEAGIPHQEMRRKL
jgi:predicted GNAT family N-acyltransferase